MLLELIPPILGPVGDKVMLLGGWQFDSFILVWTSCFS